MTLEEIIHDDSDLVEEWDEQKEEMNIWFQLPLNITTGKDDSTAQEDCQQECEIITSYLLTKLIFNSSEIVDIAVNRTSVHAIVNGEIRAGEQISFLNA